MVSQFSEYQQEVAKHGGEVSESPLQSQLSNLSLVDSAASMNAMKPAGSSYINDLPLDLVEDSGAELIADNSVCVTGSATYYEPTGSRTADGTAYTSGNNALGAAYPMQNFRGGNYSDATPLNMELGDRIRITNTATGATHTTFVIDRGDFAREHGQYGPRRVDLTRDSAARLGFGPEGNGAGQIPVRVCNLDP
ncbi:hypothetical protein GC174_16355 [bacterium]|nr:hypothetical protein [bacterium]